MADHGLMDLGFEGYPFTWNNKREGGLSKYSFMSRLKTTKLALKEWNKKVFGNVDICIKETKAAIKKLQSQGQDECIVRMEKDLQIEIDEMLKREESLWRDKAKSKWLQEGDTNTCYFHLTTILHRKYNSITSILSPNNSWISKRQDIRLAFQEYFESIFSSVEPQYPKDFQNLFTPVIGREENNKLNLIPTEDEIHRAVFSMGSNKSPSMDGMTVNFYKSYWSIIKEDVVKEVQMSFQLGTIKAAHNHTFIALIPKSVSASKVDQFRPIALCNVFLKIITKIIANRLRAHLDNIIYPCQSAFIPHRAITDNIIINHEVMHYLKCTKGRKGFMAIKIDLPKSYDSVEWKVLIHPMRKLSFNKQFTDLIASCISSTQFSILLNGSPYGFFKIGRGIRHGELLRYLLFFLTSYLGLLPE